jgi:hypothetical protein
MTDSVPDDDLDPEVLAISTVHKVLKGLDAAAQERVIIYVAKKLNLELHGAAANSVRTQSESDRTDSQAAPIPPSSSSTDDADGLEGISPVAKKWMSRNGLKADQLSALFSLGVDEIDLVARKVPGANKKDRMRSVILMKGIAAYLSSGAARVTHEQIKEACLHYDAYDGGNFAAYIRAMSAEISGAKEGGYTLSARGLTSATELLKGLTETGKGTSK